MFFKLATFRKKLFSSLGKNPHILTSVRASHLIIQPDQNKASSQHYSTEQKMSSPTIQNLNKSNNTSPKFSSPMDTSSISLTNQEDNGVLNNQAAEKEPEPVRRINLPYIQGISEQLQRTLSHHNIKSTF